MQPTNRSDVPMQGRPGRSLRVVTLCEVGLFVIAGVLASSAVLLVIAVIIAVPMPDALNPRIVWFTGVMVACYAGIALALATGLRRRKFWAWDGTVFSLILCGGMGLLAASLAFAGNWAIALTGTLLLSISWLTGWHLFRPVVTAAFPFVPSRDRPTPSNGIRLIAAYHLFTPFVQLGELLDPVPARILGTVPSGPLLILYAIASGLLGLCIGFGLYSVRLWAQRWAIIYTLWTTAFWIIKAVSQPSTDSPAVFLATGALLGLATPCLILWQLISKRREFS